MNGAPAPANRKARQAALAILAEMLGGGDTQAMLAKLNDCDAPLVIVSLSVMLFESLITQGIPPAEWVAAMRARPVDEPGPANGLAWQN